MYFRKENDDLVCIDIRSVSHGAVFRNRAESQGLFNSLFGEGIVRNVYAEVSLADATENCVDFPGRLILEMSTGKFVGFVGYGSGGVEGAEIFSVQVE